MYSKRKMYRQQFITKNLHIVAKSRYISILREKKICFRTSFQKQMYIFAA